MHEFQGKSKQLRNELNFHWSAFTAEDLHMFDGRRDDLIRLFESRYEFARGPAEREADWFLRQFQDKLIRAS